MFYRNSFGRLCGDFRGVSGGLLLTTKQKRERELAANQVAAVRNLANGLAASDLEWRAAVDRVCAAVERRSRTAEGPRQSSGLEPE